jgi:cytolysin-activating lysine-acyltransferase
MSQLASDKPSNKAREHTMNGTSNVEIESKASESPKVDGNVSVPRPEFEEPRIAGALRPTAATAIGEICTLMLMLPRYRHVYLQDLEWLVMAPLVRGRLSVVRTGEKDGDEKKYVVGGVLWARVSSEVDKAIREQVRAGVFPIRLKPDDWNSGDTTWVLDVLAPNKLLASKIFAEIGRQGLGGVRKLNAHPIVQQLVDAELLKKMGAKIERVESSSTLKNPVAPQS